MKHQDVLFNVTGQSFFYDPPEGRPDASPTPGVTVYLSMTDDVNGTTEAATTGTCSIDSVNTTTTSAIATGSNTIALTSASGVTRLRRYLLIAANGDREWVEVVTISGLNITTRQPIINAYASGATFQGTRISIAVDSTWVATAAKISDVLATTWRTTKESHHEWSAGYAGYRLRWTYSYAGAPTLGISFADLVRYTAKNLVTPLDVDARFPGWIDRLPTDYREDQGASLIEEAFQALRYDAIGDDQVLRRIRNTEILRELVIARAPLQAAEAKALAGAQNAAELEVARGIYTHRYDQLMREPKFQVDQLGSGASHAARRLPVYRR